MPISKESAALWDRANKRTAAQHGLPGSDPADAITKAVTIKSLIRSIGSNPDALELLASRSHELTDAQRMAALKAFAPPKAAKVAKAQPKAAPKARSRLAGFPLRGFHSGAQT